MNTNTDMLNQIVRTTTGAVITACKESGLAKDRDDVTMILSLTTNSIDEVSAAARGNVGGMIAMHIRGILQAMGSAELDLLSDVFELTDASPEVVKEIEAMAKLFTDASAFIKANASIK